MFSQNEKDLYSLGLRYMEGRGLPRDQQKAKFYFESAAKQGDKRAQFALGYMYDNGLSVPSNAQIAIDYYNAAAKQDHEGAQYNLGIMYKDGQGVPVNVPKAISYFKSAAKRGFLQALFTLGEIYDNGESVGDLKQAVYYFKLAAEQGHPIAQYNLGTMYERGEGVSKNFKKAIRYYILAVSQENKDAQYALGRMYREGRGVTKDLKKAASLFQLAAAQGHVESFFASITLPAPEEFDDAFLKILGEVVIGNIYEITPHQRILMSGYYLILQKVGSAFIDFANQSKPDLNPLAKEVSIILIRALEMKKLDESGTCSFSDFKKQCFSYEQAYDIDGLYILTQYDLDFPQPYFVDFFKKTFHDKSVSLQKWHAIFSILVEALNKLNYQKKRKLLPIPEIISLNNVMKWIEKIRLQLMQHHKGVEEEKGRALVEFLDFNASKALGSHGPWLNVVRDRPLERFALGELYALREIIKKIELKGFIQNNKRECVDAIQRAIFRKDPNKKFFAPKDDSHYALFNLIWNGPSKNGPSKNDPEFFSGGLMTQKKASNRY